MYFRLVLTVDRKPNLGMRAANLVRGVYTDPEASFWNDLRRASKLVDQESRTPRDVNAAKLKMREQFAEKLRVQVVEELKKDYHGVALPGMTADELTNVREINEAISGIRFRKSRVFGVVASKFSCSCWVSPSSPKPSASPRGICQIHGFRSADRDELNLRGHDGAISADATPVGDERPLVGESSGASAQSRRVEPSMGSLYFMPALFSAVAFGAAMYAFVQISSRMVDERAAYGGYVRDEMKDISQERREIATS